ncbi:LysR family transcriptional regulator [Prosthecomicrobium sp. N25]|uniref:LysR family transcriptional regulator n=1 Tax=Prosthecomicrobium sp. N25 TaxID=3129254 RepID=UPI0030773956
MQRETQILSSAYRYFVAVAAAGSIRGAARELNIVASAVNRQILLLEAQLGLELFERVGRGLRLSEAGTVLLRSLNEIVGSYEEVAAELDAFRGLKRGRVRVATVESVSVNVLPDILARFWIEFPGIEIVTTVAGSEAVTRLVADGDADVAFSFNPDPSPTLRVLHEEAFRIGALMRPDHPLARRASLTMAELAREPLALPKRGLSLRSAVDPALARLGRALRPRLESDSLRHMAALARRGQVVAFQTPVGIEAELAEGSLVLVPLSDPDVAVDRLVVMAGAGRTPSLAMTVFSEHAKAALEARRTALREPA